MPGGEEQPVAPTVEVCPGGPLLLRGKHVVVAADGSRHETERPVSAVCRCSRSGTLPWCDGTHKLLPPDRRPGA
ncbi:CDGSH iron-sulfur domain-containing protein [Nocardioides terrisoli]|uniref:CDGSH iron-sulfur domain-containing protein n=1 Tax=Nocardioides terrisoli TaxID=3388267 RepID=UPI00287BC38D|nr:CDGSH iron-sulfur domain-containing protein [Nocardioides marmorisolisilvae]